jgi:hypothetical protein
MSSDIAFGERSEDRVDERVENNIGIGVTGQTPAVENAHAAQHDVVAISELMNVETESRAYIAQVGEAEGFRACKILVAGELDVSRFTFKRGDVETRPLRKRRIVGEIVTTRHLRPAMGVEQGGETEGLRGLRHSDHRAVDGPGHNTCRINGLDCIGYADDRDCGYACMCGRDRARDESWRDERPRRIVDEDQIGTMGLQRLEAGADGALPRIGTVHRRQQAKAFGRGLVKIVVVGVDHRLHDGNLAVSSEGCKDWSDHGFPEDAPVLLGQVSARAQSTSGSYDDGCDLHCFVLS